MTGNLLAAKFVGDGSGLYNIAGASADRIVGGSTSMLALGDSGFVSRVVEDENMARFYKLDVQPTSFGEWLLVREWGQIGRPGTVRVGVHASEVAFPAPIAPAHQIYIRDPASKALIRLLQVDQGNLIWWGRELEETAGDGDSRAWQ